jgi:hypothetical protein
VDSVIVNNNVRDDIRDFPVALQVQFRQFLEHCTAPLADVDDPTYLDTQVYQVLQPPPEACFAALSASRDSG